MLSSGQLADERTRYAECTNCGFEGRVDEFLDVEVFAAGWECPSCGVWHDTSGEVF